MQSALSTNAGSPLRAGRLQPGVLGLMQRVLRPGGNLVAEYPTVFGAEARGEVLWIGSADLPEAALALEVVRMHGAAKELKLGLVGSVCTAEHARGRGHASALLDFAAERAAAAGCDALMLWPDDADFYARRGFAEVGTEMDLIFGADRLLHLPQVEARPAGSAEAPELMALYNDHAARTDRDVASFARLLNGPGLATLVSWEGTKCRAYAVCGRGGDMQGVVHEWGGEFEIALGLVRAHGERLLLNSAWPDYDLVMLAPPGNPQVIQTAIEFGARVHLGSLGMARSVTPTGDALLKECLPLRNPDQTQGFLWGLDSI